MSEDKLMEKKIENMSVRDIVFNPLIMKNAKIKYKGIIRKRAIITIKKEVKDE